MNDSNVMHGASGFYRIYSFMERELGLKGGELRIYALIFSFTSGDAGMYFGTKKYLAGTLNLSVRTVYRALASLFERGLIENAFDRENGRSGVRCTYMREEKGEEQATAAPTAENSEFVREIKERALDNMVIKRYGNLPKEIHLAARQAIRDRLKREARERLVNETVRRVMLETRRTLPQKDEKKKAELNTAFP